MFSMTPSPKIKNYLPKVREKWSELQPLRNVTFSRIARQKKPAKEVEEVRKVIQQKLSRRSGITEAEERMQDIADTLDRSCKIRTENNPSDPVGSLVAWKYPVRLGLTLSASHTFPGHRPVQGVAGAGATVATGSHLLSLTLIPYCYLRLELAVCVTALTATYSVPALQLLGNGVPRTLHHGPGLGLLSCSLGGSFG